MKEFWNERFGRPEYVYGQLPNEYVKEKLSALSSPGKILFPCEGEGRNAVYAAQQGWEAEAFDQSEEGKRKAELLAGDKGVSISYTPGDVEEVEYPAAGFDVLALIYAHFPEGKRREYHQKLISYLKKGGYLIIEGFSKKHTANQKLNPNAGGPRDIGMLYDLEELKHDFTGFDFIEAYETETVLSEGEYHKGKADVVRILAQAPR